MIDLPEVLKNLLLNLQSMSLVPACLDINLEKEKLYVSSVTWVQVKEQKKF